MPGNLQKLTGQINEALRFNLWYPFGHKPAAGAPQPLVNPWQFHLDTLIATWIGMALMILLALYVRKKLTMVPQAKSAQNFLEMIWEFFEQIGRDLVGDDAKKYLPLVVSIFFFVLVGNLLGLLPEFTPYVGSYTRDANTTIGLAVFSLLAFTFYGLMKKGIWGWIKHFADPVPHLAHTLEGPIKYIMIPFLFVLFVVLNIVEELARVISLSMRLFGNIMGKHIVMAALFALTIFLSPVFWPLPTFVWPIGLIASIVQAMVFALLTLAYIAGAVGEHH